MGFVDCPCFFFRKQLGLPLLSERYAYWLEEFPPKEEGCKHVANGSLCLLWLFGLRNKNVFENEPSLVIDCVLALLEL